MITIKLTYKQFQACRYWATQRHHEYLNVNPSDFLTDKKRTVTMPYPGWQTLAARLEQAAFDRWGRHTTKLADTAGSGTASALTVISRKLAKAAGHPALRHEIVIGYSADEFIAWPASPWWTLWPIPGKPAIRLEPRFEPNPVVTAGHHQMRFKEGITYWIAAGTVADPGEYLGWSVDEDQATGT